MERSCENHEQFTARLTADLIGLMAKDGGLLSLMRAVTRAGEEAAVACSGRPAACGAGCPYCCVLNVAILLPEALAIASWLRDTWTDEDREALAARLTKHSTWGRWMDDEERVTRQAYCPFLDPAGSCSIHPVRPLACRGVASLDRAACRMAFNPIISDQDRTVPADLLRRLYFDSAFSCLGAALRHNGMDDRSIELGAGVRALLASPAYAEMLLAGTRLPRELWA